MRPSLYKVTLLYLICAFACTTHADIVVITHHSAPIDSLSKSQVRGIFLKKLLVFPGTSIPTTTVDQHKNTIERKIFYEHITNKSPRMMNAYWARYVFTGKSQPPKELQDSQSILDYVSDNINSIGYIDESLITDDVKIVYRIATQAPSIPVPLIPAPSIQGDHL